MQEEPSLVYTLLGLERDLLMIGLIGLLAAACLDTDASSQAVVTAILALALSRSMQRAYAA